MEIFTILRSFFDLDFMDDVKYPLFYDFMRKNKILHMHISIYKNFKFSYKIGFLFFTICFIFVGILLLFLFYRSNSMHLKQKVCLGLVSFVVILFFALRPHCSYEPLRITGNLFRMFRFGTISNVDESVGASAQRHVAFWLQPL